jgi:hypothetical protein
VRAGKARNGSAVEAVCGRRTNFHSGMESSFDAISDLDMRFGADDMRAAGKTFPMTADTGTIERRRDNISVMVSREIQQCYPST